MRYRILLIALALVLIYAVTLFSLELSDKGKSLTAFTQIKSSLNHSLEDFISPGPTADLSQSMANNTIHKNKIKISDDQNITLSLSTVQSKRNLARLLSILVEDRLEEAVNLLKLTSVQPEVASVNYAVNISTKYMGIPGNLDIQKRNIGLSIIKKDPDFGSVYFLVPNGDIYIGEPFSDQKQLPRLNFADRDWYKGITNIQNLYTDSYYISSVFLSASIHVPAIAIAVPVFSINSASGDISNNRGGAFLQTMNSNASSSSLIGYWVGILDLASLDGAIKNLVLEKGERFIIFDHNGTEIADSDALNNNSYSKVKATLRDFGGLHSVKEALKARQGQVVEDVNGTKMLSYFEPIEAGSHIWGLILSVPYSD